MKKIAILFPGQGSQYLGMGQAFIESDPDAAALMQKAEDISGFPIQRLCTQGPLEDLTRVLHLQPALTVVNLIVWQQFRKALPDCRPTWLAGHSLGEYSALHASGVLSVEDTLHLVTKRGEFMERENAAHPGGMRAVLGLTIDAVEEVLAAYQGPGTVVVANHNSQQQNILSGDEQGLADLTVLCQAKGAKKILPLKVAGANHSPLVAGAVPDFAACMEKIPFHPPQIPLLFNVTAAQAQDSASIRNIMAHQIAARVRWYESIQQMHAAGVEVFLELGPGTVLTGMMKKILPAGSSVLCMQADSPESLAKVSQALA